MSRGNCWHFKHPWLVLSKLPTGPDSLFVPFEGAPLPRLQAKVDFVEERVATRRLLENAAGGGLAVFRGGFFCQCFFVVLECF